jgi:hypothetical protein
MKSRTNTLLHCDLTLTGVDADRREKLAIQWAHHLASKDGYTVPMEHILGQAFRLADEQIRKESKCDAT